MSCTYYTFKSSLFGGDYYCLKKNDYVNSETYDRYCKNYSYSDCPIYKQGNNSSGGCYLTSACTLAKGLSDDCYELTTLRQYRDEWLAKIETGEEIIKKYYEIAPKVVSAINDRLDKLDIYNYIYENMIQPCVRLIEEEKYEEALEVYKSWTLKLQEEYC